MAAPMKRPSLRDRANVVSSITLTVIEEPPVSQPEKPVPFWHQPGIWITLMMMPLVYIVVLIVLTPSNNYSNEIKVMVITGVLTLLTGLVGFWFAGAFDTKKKDEPATPSPTTINNNAPTPASPSTVINNQGTT